jgi:pSer/pThr/pTyr-binding forkhead associated (FHA) protein
MKGISMASLFVVSGGDKVDYYPLGNRTTVVGRDEAVPIQVVDKQVSRKHMQIRLDKHSECYYAIDMASRNGVFINGRKIDEETVLADGDRIHIGDTDILFTLKDFPDRENAMHNFKKVGERKFSTSDE